MFRGPSAAQSPATRQSGGTWLLIFLCLGFGGSGQIATCTSANLLSFCCLSLSLPILPWCVKSGYRKRESIDAPAAAFLFPSLVERGLGASCWRGKTPAPRADCPIGHTQLQPVTGRGTDSDSCPSPLPSLSRALGQPAERHTPDNVIQGSRRAEWVPSGRKPELSVTTVSPDASQLPLHHPASVSARRRVSHRSP